VTRERALSRPARTLLAALLKAPHEWRHGYDLASETGLKSGTLYPLLIRLESQGYLEAEWRQPVASGRPPRHAYRLSAVGHRLACALAAEGTQPVSMSGLAAGKVAS
jgi:DNA-binding PadR family transcriptional regulator